MYKGIFGGQAPKFIYDLGGANEATVYLDYWETRKDEPDEREDIQENEVIADRTIRDLGDFWEYEGIVHLHRYNTMAIMRSKFEEIYQYNKKEVVLYRHRDGLPFKDSTGNNVLFYMKITPKSRGVFDFRDLLFVNFRSLTGVDFSDNSPIVTPVTEIIMS